MDRWNGKVAVVTGASSGIGAAIAENLVNNGMKVVGLARRLNRLEELGKKVSGKKGKFYPVKCDIAKEDDILAAFKWVEENLHGLHVLINNAGIARPGPIEGTQAEDWRQTYLVNVLGLQICCGEAVKSMKLHQIDGHIINISSVAAHYSSPPPGYSTYFASKKAVNTITEGLRVELGLTKSKIKVTTICPGLVITEIIELANFKIPPNTPALKPEDIASSVEYVLQLPPNVLITELIIRDVIDPTKELMEALQNK